MKGKTNSKGIYTNNQVLKKKSKTHKSQRSMDHLKAEEDNYLKDIYINSDLTDYNEPEWDGVDYLPTGSVEEYDDSDEESEVVDDDPMDDNDPVHQHNEPALPLEDIQAVLGHYRINK